MKDENVEVLEPELTEQFDTGDMVTFGAAAALLGIAIFAGGAIITGVITGLAATFGLGIFIWKTKRHAPKCWNWMVDHPIKTDIGISVLFFATMVAGATLGGLVAGTSAVVFSTAGLPLMKYVGKVEGVEELKFSMKDLLPKQGSKQAVAFNS